MKSRILNTLIGSLLLSMGVTHADVVFQETFPNSGEDTNLATIAWHANVGATAVVQDNNKAYSVSPILSVADYIFTRPSDSGNPWLAWTDKASISAIGSISSVTNISVSLRNGSAIEDLKIALKVNDAWYVSQTVLNSPSESSFVTVGIAVQSVAWNHLDFVPGSNLGEGSAVALPASGTVQAVGVFDASTTASKAVRIDNYTVEAIPEPTTLGLVGIVAITLIGVRRLVM